MKRLLWIVLPPFLTALVAAFTGFAAVMIIAWATGVTVLVLALLFPNSYFRLNLVLHAAGIILSTVFAMRLWIPLGFIAVVGWGLFAFIRLQQLATDEANREAEQQIQRHSRP